MAQYGPPRLDDTDPKIPEPSAEIFEDDRAEFLKTWQGGHLTIKRRDGSVSCVITINQRRAPAFEESDAGTFSIDEVMNDVARAYREWDDGLAKYGSVHEPLTPEEFIAAAYRAAYFLVR